MAVEITIKPNPTSLGEQIQTDGYVLLYLSGNKIQVKGQLDIQTLMPYVAKIIMEKMTK